MVVGTNPFHQFKMNEQNNDFIPEKDTVEVKGRISNFHNMIKVLRK